jgi:hypothetical protein
LRIRSMGQFANPATKYLCSICVADGWCIGDFGPTPAAAYESMRARVLKDSALYDEPAHSDWLRRLWKGVDPRCIHVPPVGYTAIEVAYAKRHTDSADA